MPANEPTEVADQFEATIVWMGDAPLLPGRGYTMMVGPKTVTASIGQLKYRIDVTTLQRVAGATLAMGEIGVCNLQLDRAIPFDPYDVNRDTGGFILVDRLSGATVGVGMLRFALRRAKNVVWQAMDVNKAARSALKAQKACLLWYTGLSGAGKSTIANLVDKKLHSLQRHTYLLDGDNVRHGLNRDLGFTDADRVENIRRIAEVAKLMVDAGLIVSTAFISPFRAERRTARALVAEGEFIEVFIDTPLAVAEQRDPKGLYKKARRGDLKNFTGIDSPYETPENPEITIDTTALTPEQAAEMIVTRLRERGVFDVTRTYAFNGDADGLCALQQLRLAGDPAAEAAATLVTGVKRDIALLERVAASASAGDEVTVLDVSLDVNRAGLLALLAAGARVRYFDHHFAGDIPADPALEPHIDTAPNVCTALLVDRYLDGQVPPLGDRGRVRRQPDRGGARAGRGGGRRRR